MSLSTELITSPFEPRGGPIVLALLKSPLQTQVVRYVVIGLGVNAISYALYLLLTWRLMGSVAAMTIASIVGTLLSFVTNRHITFRHRGSGYSALRRFMASYVFLYFMNFVALWIFSYRIGFPHQIVQLFVTAALPLFNFVIQKRWVFTESSERRPGPSARNTQS